MFHLLPAGMQDRIVLSIYWWKRHSAFKLVRGVSSVRKVPTETQEESFGNLSRSLLESVAGFVYRSVSQLPTFGRVNSSLALLGIVLLPQVLYGQDKSLPLPSMIKGLPYTATQWTTTIVHLADGTDKTTVGQIALARSSDGMVRRETHQPSDGEIKNPATPITAIVILDPEKNSATFLSPLNLVATVTMHPKTRVPTTSSVHVSSAPDTTNSPTVDLGKDEIDGFSVSGRRNSYTIMESESGVQHAVTLTTDTWYSSDLHIILKSETHDSKGLSSVTTLTDIKQGEPDSSLFTIPTNYKTITR